MQGAHKTLTIDVRTHEKKDDEVERIDKQQQKQQQSYSYRNKGVLSVRRSDSHHPNP